MLHLRKILLCLLCTTATAKAQQVLTLDDCRQMAMEQNKQISVARMEKTIADNTQKIARTKYLPRLSAIGGYEWTSREVSLLSDDTKNSLSNLGTNAGNKAATIIGGKVQELKDAGILDQQQAMKIQQIAGNLLPTITPLGDAFGQKVVDAFRTDTRNMFAASLLITQPLYMGGAITAGNRLADIKRQMADEKINMLQDETVYGIDETYWMVVSLKNKQRLAARYNQLVCHLDSDVVKMIREGVATRADGLKINVKKNESEITMLQVENGLALAKMLLCQKCGLPLDSDITLADEDTDALSLTESAPQLSTTEAIENRSEIKLLKNAEQMTLQATKLARAEYLPQAMLTAGYLISNPNVLNGFERKFGGVFNIGVMVRVPIWNWFESEYKIRATKAATSITQYEISEAKELMELQIQQARYKLQEAQKRLQMAQKNINSAEENLRCANLGFREGVMNSTEVIGAQTAWMQAQTMKIDSEIDVKMSLLALKKALGIKL